MNHPPPLPVPPPLPPPPGKPAPKLSPGRRWARWIVWGILGVVLVARWFNPPDPRLTWGQLVGRQPEPPPRRWEDRRFSRPPTQLRNAAKPLPADLWRLEIQIADADVNTLRNHGWTRPPRDGMPRDERPEVLVTIREGGNLYTNVALHMKGSMGSFRPFDDKPALTLNFSKHAKGQSFHGFNKISLNNSVQDPTFIAEALCRELFTAAGVPAPSATHASAVINGRDMGLYVVLEGWGKPFLHKHFPDVHGNLYEGPFASEIHRNLEVNSGDQPDDHSDLDRLLQVMEGRDRTELWKRLGEVIDCDRFATMLALEVMTCHWDGYSLNRNNFRVFHDRSTDRLIFLPHGMDQMFGQDGRMPPNSSIHPSTRGAVARIFMSTREGRSLYTNRVASLTTNLFRAEKLVGRVHELAQRLQPTLAAYGPDLAARHAAEVEDLCRRITERCDAITTQLNAAPPPTVATTFDAAGHSVVRGWKSRTAAPASANYDRVREGDQNLLRITATGGSSGSWRTQVTLPPGDYVFEGTAVVGAVGAPGGIRLRISGNQTQWIQAPAGTRTPLQFAFGVQDMMTTVELICELGGPVGQASFDESTLRLTRQ